MPLANRLPQVSTTHLVVAICLRVVYSTLYYKVLVYHRDLLGIYSLRVQWLVSPFGGTSLLSNHQRFGCISILSIRSEM